MYFEILDFNHLEIEQIIKIMDKNHKTASMLEAEIKQIKNISTKQNKDNDEKFIPKKDKTLDKKSKEFKDEEFENEVNYYLEGIKGLSTEDVEKEIDKFLPSKKNYNYDKIILRIKAELLKNIKDIKELIVEFDGLSKEDLISFKEEIELNKRKINEISRVTNDQSKQNNTEINKENELIFAPTNGGNIRVLEELDKIPPDYYENFLELFKSIKDNTFKNVKRLTSMNNKTSGVCEVRGFKTRVVFARLDNQKYVVITAFIKKSDKDKGYIEQLQRKIAEYRDNYQKIKDNLDNKEFLDTQKELEKELFNKLSKSTYEDKKGENNNDSKLTERN